MLYVEGTYEMAVGVTEIKTLKDKRMAYLFQRPRTTNILLANVCVCYWVFCHSAGKKNKTKVNYSIQICYLENN